MNHRSLCLAILAATSIAACASVDPQPQSAEAKSDKVYTTGSRIPVRDRDSGSASVRSVDGKSVDDMLNKRDVITTSPKGAQ